MFKELLLPVLIVLAFVVLLLWVLPTVTGKELVGHHSLRSDHLSLMELGLQNNHDLRAETAEINRKLDILLNIATNSVDGMKVAK